MRPLPAPSRWRALCAVLLAPPACTTSYLRSMRDCPLDAPWPLRSERHNNLEVFGLSGQQAGALDLMQDDEAQTSAVAALDEQVEHEVGEDWSLHPRFGWLEG